MMSAKLDFAASKAVESVVVLAVAGVQVESLLAVVVQSQICASSRTTLGA